MQWRVNSFQFLSESKKKDLKKKNWSKLHVLQNYSALSRDKTRGKGKKQKHTFRVNRKEIF